MVKYPFNGNLNPNEIFSSIYNMIISQEFLKVALADNYALVDKFKVDGTLYGDTKLFYDHDILKSRAWGGDSEAANLLNINRPADPVCQAITLDQFRQIDITVDQYLSKRAWGTETAFADFTSFILGMIGRTKRLYEVTMFNTYIGTAEGAANKATVEVDLNQYAAITDVEAKNRLEAQEIATSLADLMLEMKDYSRDFNDFKYMKAFNEGELMFVVNGKWANKITYMDLPTIFHKDGINKLTENILPARYFGNIADAVLCAADVYDASTNPDGELDQVTANKKYTVRAGVVDYRSLVEIDYTVSGTVYHLFPGDVIPAGATFDVGTAYKEDGDIICKIMTPETFKYMSAFEVGTEFFNPRSLTTNHYLTWGFSKPDRLKGMPLVTVYAD